MHNKTLREISLDLAGGAYSSEEITRELLQRIERLNGPLNAFVSQTPDLAIDAARQADQRRAAGNATRLTGVPMAHKDIFCTKGVRTSAGSRMLDNFISPYDATVVERLQSEGMVCLGKTNMDEFAMGSSNETSWYGPVHNPWKKGHVPGGSSGGSAAAVAARLVPATTGTDTGGSIRQPASLCGITGLKPTYGRVSRWGMVAFASSLDQAGPMARTAEDCALLLQSMAGFDERDSTCMDEPVPDYIGALDQSVSGLKIGLPKEYFNAGLDSAMGELLHQAAEQLVKMGATLHEVSLPHADLAISTYYIIAPAECSTNLSRYDGVRYGYRCDDPKDLTDLYCRSRSEAFGDEVKRRILVGTYVLSAGFYDAYYRQAQKARRLIRDDFATAFAEVDLILSPSALGTAFAMGSKTTNPVDMYKEDLYTIPVNLAGLPAITAPCGFIDGMPAGLQLVAPHFAEARLLNVAHQYQQQTDWHLAAPDMSQWEVA
jgi:aspartyl-tRNA(Asn)/glutamyl-tRNA(Gln) amidotransferase subunit A